MKMKMKTKFILIILILVLLFITLLTFLTSLKKSNSSGSHERAPRWHKYQIKNFTDFLLHPQEISTNPLYIAYTTPNDIITRKEVKDTTKCIVKILSKYYTYDIAINNLAIGDNNVDYQKDVTASCMGKKGNWINYFKFLQTSNIPDKLTIECRNCLLDKAEEMYSPQDFLNNDPAKTFLTLHTDKTSCKSCT
jgi:hypothetical protein